MMLSKVPVHVELGIEMNNEFIKKELLPKQDHSYPVSRDWEDIDCNAKACKYNRHMKCSVPSLAKIGEDGKCQGFTPLRKDS